MVTPITDHPARFSAPILDKMAELLDEFLVFPEKGKAKLIDPMVGVGGAHSLANERIQTYGIELEPEWAACHDDSRQGDARHLRAAVKEHWGLDPGSFDCVCTSPAYASRMADNFRGSMNEKCRDCNGTGGIGKPPHAATCERCGGLGKAPSKRVGYTVSLGRDLSEGSGAALQWSQGYRYLHEQIAVESCEVLKRGGLMVVNVSNHIRQKQVIRVVEWWLTMLMGTCGLDLVTAVPVRTRRMRYGENGEARVDGEMILVLRK